MPVAFASVSVWHAPQPDDVNTVLPAAGSPVGAGAVVALPVDVVVSGGPAASDSGSAANFSTAPSSASMNSGDQQDEQTHPLSREVRVHAREDERAEQ